MIKLHTNRKQIVFLLFCGIALITIFHKFPETGSAQHKAERRSSTTKSKSKTKAANLANGQNVQQQTNADGSINGVLWIGEAGVTETTAEIMSREQSLLSGQARASRKKEREPERDHIQPDRSNLPQNPEALPGASWPPPGEGEIEDKKLHDILNPTSLKLAVTPTPSLSYTAATLAETSAYPPDTMGAVGPSQFLLAVNGRIRVFNKTNGARGELDADIDSFFNSVRAGDITTDPRVRYDRLSGRWFIVIINTTSSNNRIILAVSNSATINSATAWTFYYFQHNLVAPSGDNGCFADYPSLGIDTHALYIGVNQFCNRAFSNTTAFVIRKSSVLNGGAIVASAFRNLIDSSGTVLGNGIFTPQGVDNNDPNAAAGYFIGTDANSFGRLVVRKVLNPGGTPVMSQNIYVNVLATAAPITVRHRGNFNGVNGRLDALDDRLFAAQMRGESIWTAHNIAVNNEGSVDAPRTRNGARWYEISGLDSNNLRMIQAGTLFTPTETNSEDERNYFIPALAVSGQGHMLIGCSTAGTNEYINAAIAWRSATDPLGFLKTPQLITNSPGPYNPSGNSGNQQGRRRWGDYSFTSVDPCDDMTMWTVQQFADAANSYGLRVAKIPAPPPAVPVSADPPSVLPGLVSVNVTITGLPSAGAGFYDPGPGFDCRLRAAVSGGVTVNSIGYLNPATVILNLSTVNAVAGTKTITITNPDGQSVSGSNLLTVGNCAYNVVAGNQSFTSGGGPGTISVEAPAGCGWTAYSNTDFISINSGSTGNGTGTVNFTVAPTAASARIGNIIVAGRTITITQTAGSGCNFSFSPSSRNFASSGGTGSFNVSTAAECGWTAVSNDSFINILFASAEQGNGTVYFSVSANTQPVMRTGLIRAGGKTFTVTQDAAPFELAVDDGSFESASGVSTGGISYRINRLTPSFYPATINAVSIHFPDNNSVKIGDAFNVVIGVNPDGDTNIDGTIFQMIPAQVQKLGEFNVVSIQPVTITEGDFVVGVQLNQAVNVFPYSLDTSKSAGRSYRSLDGATFALVDTLGTAGNYGIRARMLRPQKLIINTGAALASESCSTPNGVIDPGETVTVNLSLANIGLNSAQNLVATLIPSGNVLTTSPSAVITQSYGSLAPGAASVMRQFTFTVSAACGGIIPVRLNLKDNSEDVGMVTFYFTAGTIGNNVQSFSYAGEPVKIPDGDARGISLPLTISGFPGNIADLNFRIGGTSCTTSPGAQTVGVDHSWVGDLIFRLTSPSGTTVTIINRPGGSGNSGKNFCQTLLDDDVASAISINNITSTGIPPQGPPYTGTYKPSNPLSAFDGENPNGVWTLTAIDGSIGDSGSVRAFSLHITGYACCSTGCLDITGKSSSSGAVGSQLTITGSGFNGVSSVKFGNVSAQFTINGNSSLTATVPANAQNAPIYLSKPGCIDAQTLPFLTFPAIALAPQSLTGIAGSAATMTINLGYAQTNGVTIALTSSNPSLAAVPATVTIPAGRTTTTFPVNGISLGGPTTITAKLPANLGGASATAAVSVAARTVKVVNSAGSIGRSVSLPIELESKGDESSVRFSLTFNPSLLINPNVVIGSDAFGGQLSINASLISQGKIGVIVSLPSGQRFAEGFRQVAILNFDLPASIFPETTTIEFGDQPTTRSVSGLNGSTILAQFVAGSLRIGKGFEGDVSPRPTGQNNGIVTITDWVQIGRFVAGLDTVVDGNEFQRADISPRETLGDGRITLADWVQAGRFVAGLETVLVAGGPTGPVTSLAGTGFQFAPNHSAKISERAKGASQVVDEKTWLERRGDLVTVRLSAEGVENALSFSLNFDPSQWRFVKATTGSGALQATVIVNPQHLQQGQVGILLALPAGKTFGFGEKEAVIFQFAPRPRANNSWDSFQLSDFPISRSRIDAFARPLP